MPTVEVNGHTLYYEESGDGEPLVLVHGDFECTRYWAAQVAALAPRFRVVAYDRHGFGRSAPLDTLPPDFYDRDAADLAHLLDRLEIERAYLVGHSGGGTVALLAAARYPDCVRALVAAGTHAYVEPLTIDYVSAFARRLDDPALQRAGAACHGARWREVAAMFAARWLDPDWQDWSILSALGLIQCPVLLMLASDDGSASREQLAAIAAAIPNARTVEVEHGGHVIHRRMPAFFNDTVMRFLESADG